MVVLDLFSGAGGLSEGFWRQGCTFVGHVEADVNACNTLKTRTAYHYLKEKGRIDEYYKYGFISSKKQFARKKYIFYGCLEKSIQKFIDLKTDPDLMLKTDPWYNLALWP